jgi:prepilin-type N-terminal cleavage/methylation domain-containing protein
MSIKNKKAFTLIELLVVVVIIAILAAIALPQYQKAVERSHAVQLKTLVKSVVNAEELYHTMHSEYTTDFEKLDISLGGNIVSGRGICNIGSVNAMKFNNFEIILATGTGTVLSGIYGFRTAGKYKCSGFGYSFNEPNIPARQILCSEPAGSAQSAKGVYCSLMGYPNLVYTSRWNDKNYSQ